MKNTLMKAIVLAMALPAFCAGGPAPGGIPLERTLTGEGRLRWEVREEGYAPPADCPLKGRFLTFVRDSSLVIEEVCEEGRVATHYYAYSISSGSRGEQISFNDLTYEARMLSYGAPVCEGFKENCIRLSSLVLGKMDRSKDLYLGR